LGILAKMLAEKITRKLAENFPTARRISPAFRANPTKSEGMEGPKVFKKKKNSFCLRRKLDRVLQKVEGEEQKRLIITPQK